MAAITPVAHGTAGWLDPNNAIPVRTSSVAATTSIKVNNDPNRRAYYFTAVDNADTWQSEFTFGAIDGAEVQHDQVGTVTSGVNVSSTAGAAKFTFVVSNDGEPMWLVLELSQ